VISLFVASRSDELIALDYEISGLALGHDPSQLPCIFLRRETKWVYDRSLPRLKPCRTGAMMVS